MRAMRPSCSRPSPAPDRVDFDDPTDLSERFDALAAGGQVSFPVSDTFFSAKFGMLTDAFGIRWMFNCPSKKT